MRFQYQNLFVINEYTLGALNDFDHAHKLANLGVIAPILSNNIM